MQQNPGIENNFASLQVNFTPCDLIKKHISDKNHVVTDEELRKVFVGADSRAFKKTRSRILLSR